jgi:hypothetical protein
MKENNIADSILKRISELFYTVACAHHRLHFFGSHTNKAKN